MYSFVNYFSPTLNLIVQDFKRTTSCNIKNVDQTTKMIMLVVKTLHLTKKCTNRRVSSFNHEVQVDVQVFLTDYNNNC